MRTNFILSTGLVLILVLAACGGTPAPSQSSTSSADTIPPTPTQETMEGSANTSASTGGGPADGTRAFVELLFAGEDEASAEYLCELIRTTVGQVMVSPLPDVPGMEASIDTSGLVYTVTSESGDTAEVTVTGKAVLTMTAQGQNTVQDLDYTASPMIFQMKNENGWKVCTS